ncbi:uncharacterized protein LOC128754161 isoform X1 [Synchiropus splendidus]|uniref:uncharacterized protein LOC128754161 isoform X1 n=2 Tax=Synchiropus splendidus TaxID=270530 RepID=UPI00237D81F4|nr:uncharacterized protein LOC128754161 isoform X1 [Synchiropus splendidus]
MNTPGAERLTQPVMSEHSRRSFYSSSSQDLRLVLLGNIGCGKTSAADTILGETAPLTPGASRSCQLRQGFSQGRKVALVEAPRWFWNGGRMEDSVKKETQLATTLLEPGPHAFLLLVPVSQFTEMECHVPGELQELFGEDVLDHTLVLLTCGDYLMGRTPERYLQMEHQGLRQIIDLCEGRYHVINNRHKEDQEQVQELFEKVDKMIQTHGAYTKTADGPRREREVKLERQERVESFSARQEEKPKLLESTYTMKATTVIDSGMESLYSRSLERKRSEEEHNIRQSFNGLYSSLEPEQTSHALPQVQRTPSYTLNAEGALLSQMSEEKPAKKYVSTFHHRINSLEGKSEELSPVSPSNSSVFFSSAPSTPTSASVPRTYAVSPTSSPSAPELRLVLLGRSGSGKSSTGNVLLGQDAFESRPDSLTPITQECAKKKSKVAGRKVAVIDTPDWFNSERPPDEVRAQISSCVALSSPGPHAFLLCVPLDQPAKTELQALRALEAVFGPEAVQKHTLVLFTHADQLPERESGGVEAYIADKRPDLLKIMEKCGDRFHILESGPGWRGRRNVEELLEKVEQTVKEAGGECYSCPAFQEAEDRVRQRQAELTRERRRGRHEEEKLEWYGQVGPYMETVAEAEEEVRVEEMEKTREEAEISVSTMNIESLPQISLSSLSPSLLQSTRERLEAVMKAMPKLLADGSMMVGDGARKVYSSPVWGTVGSRAQNVQKMVVDSSVWEKVGSTAGHVSKLVGDRVPQVVVDSSAWVGSGAKAAAASPMWSKVGSGAKIVAENSKRVGAGLGTGAKNLAKSPVWGTVGSGAKTGAKLMADGSMKVGAGIGAGAKKVAQSPVWGKMGSGAKAGAKAGVKMVAESPVWEKLVTAAKTVPKVVIAGAVLGLLLGVFLGGVIGGAIGTAAGSAAAEVGRRKLTNKDTDEVMDKVQKAMSDRADAAATQGEKVLKRE